MGSSLRPSTNLNRTTILMVIAGALLIILVVIIFIRVATGNDSSISTQPSAAEKVASAFYNAIKQQDYKDAYNYLSLAQQKQITQDVFIQFAQQQDKDNGVVTNYKIIRSDGDTNNSSQVVVQMRITRDNSHVYTIALTMLHVKEDGAWKVQEEDRPI
jgi:hypothetical protein